MSKFFDRLVSEGVYNEWYEILDWLFDDKFKNWTKGQIGCFTKQVKKLPKIGKKTYQAGSVKNLVFPKTMDEHKLLKIIISKTGSEGRDIVRHIRNGIAHGRTRIYKPNGILHIEITDYKDESRKKQTAYIYMPLNYINEILKIYKSIEKTVKKESSTAA